MQRGRSARLSWLAPLKLALCKAQLTARQDLVQLLSLPAWGHRRTGRPADRQGGRAAGRVYPSDGLSLLSALHYYHVLRLLGPPENNIFSLNTKTGVSAMCNWTQGTRRNANLSALLFSKELRAGSERMFFFFVFFSPRFAWDFSDMEKRRWR